MRTRSFVAGAAAGLLVCLVGLRSAHADPKAEVQQKIKEGMENYDLMDYDNAKKALNTAIERAKTRTGMVAAFKSSVKSVCEKATIPS